MTVQTRIIAALVCTLTLAGLAICLYEVGRRDGYAQRDLLAKAEDDVAEKAALQTEVNQTYQLTKAINVRTDKTQSNRADSVRADAERNRVRVTFNSIGAGLQLPAATCADNQAAERKLLDSIGVAVDKFAEGVERIAAEADGHASDSLTYQQGWPK